MNPTNGAPSPFRYKTGQRVPVDGDYRDQYGLITRHEAHRTFPPCIGRKGEAAYRTLVVMPAHAGTTTKRGV